MAVLHAIADVILILAALLSLVAFAFLAYAGWTVFQLVKSAKGEITVLSGTAKESLGEVQGTAHYVSESIVKPATTAFGYVTAVRATLKALTEEVVKKSKN